MSRIPDRLDLINIQASLRDVWDAIDKINNNDIDLGDKRRVKRAKIATDPSDYVTLQQLRSFNKDSAVSEIIESVSTVDVIYLDAVSVGNSAGATNSVLGTYSVRGNTLNNNGDFLWTIAFGTLANNANAKTCEVYFGATRVALNQTTSSGGGYWHSETFIARVSASAQASSGHTLEREVGIGDSVIFTASPAEDLTGSVALQVRGGGAGANDVVKTFFMVVRGRLKE